ncbi:MAG: cell division protein FtsW [Deltaproteobacteria bacterium]|nr:cell division protein FtsW [Deltaproteobacteria bacterium]MBW2696063.1 cell division protein FtsW [Deltaproteobacteria bacterium]
MSASRKAAARRGRSTRKKRDTRNVRPERRDTRAVAGSDWPPGLDGGVAFAALLLCSFGVVMSYSSTATLALDQRIPPLFLHHVGALVMGLAAGAIAWSMPTTALRQLALPFWTLSTALLFATQLFGVEVNGATRWLAVPGIDLRFQPAELAKLATALAVAAVVARRDGHAELSARRALVAGALALPPIALLVRQPDLGNAVLLACLVALLLFVAGTKLARLVAPGVIAFLGVAYYISNHEYAWRRLVGFLDPWATSSDEGFQLVQSFVAFGRGGLFGVGLGSGQQKLAYLPEAHTDFILALVAEELGLIGVLAVLGGFAALLVAGTRIATRANDRFALLVGFGMTTLLTVPAVVNASVVMGLLPTKGLTLPFLSYGRTSLVVSCIALGILLGVARGNSEAGVPRWR